MKAKTLLETLVQLHTERGKSITDRDIDRITTFYSLPFTPEMLTGEKAIFAGWVDKEGIFRLSLPFDDNLNHIFQLIFDVNSVDVMCRLWQSTVERHRVDQELMLPQTIAQFISDCTRAGIPLTFTPYGEKLWRGEQ